MVEEWRDVKGFEGAYLVSNFGRVKSVTRKVKVINGYRTCNSKILKNIDYDGYYKVLLSYKEFLEKKKYVLVHRLVAESFLEKIEGYEIINHKDFNRKNNFFENLEWCDTKININHSAEKGRMNNARRVVLKDVESGEEFIVFGSNRVSAFLGYSKNHFNYHYENGYKTLSSKYGKIYTYKVYNSKGELI